MTDPKLNFLISVICIIWLSKNYVFYLMFPPYYLYYSEHFWDILITMNMLRWDEVHTQIQNNINPDLSLILYEETPFWHIHKRFLYLKKIIMTVFYFFATSSKLLSKSEAFV